MDLTLFHTHDGVKNEPPRRRRASPPLVIRAAGRYHASPMKTSLTRIRHTMLASILLTLSSVVSALADPPPACWSAEALAAKPGEERAIRLTSPVEPTGDAPAATTPVPRDAPRGVVRRVRLPDGDRRIALTFDLCESAREIAGYDGRIVDLLRAEGVRATFFAGGHWMRTHGERAAQLLADPLFEVGQHGWSHRNLAVLGGDDLRREIDAATVEAARVRSELLARPCMAGVAIAPLKSFRYPFGDCDDAAQTAVRDAGLTAIQWDVAPGDPAPGIGARAIARTIVNDVRPGSIVVLHANGRGRRTAEALAIAIPELRARGYAFATIRELLAAGEPEIETRCFVSRPGDTLRYRRAR